MSKVLNSVNLREFIEQSQWEELMRRVDAPLVETEEESSYSWFSGPSSSLSSQRRHSFLGVLSLESEHRYYENSRSRPPMPLTKLNKEKLQALGFAISDDGYWAIWHEEQQLQL